MSDVEIRDGLSAAMLGEASKPTDQRFKSLIQELFSLVQELFQENDDLKKSVAHVKSVEDQVKEYEDRIEALEEALRLLASSQLTGDSVSQLQTKVRKFVSEILRTPSENVAEDIELDSVKDSE